MSIETRQALVDDPRLVLQNPDTQRADLLDPERTDTWLVEFLLQLIATAGHPILVTALNSDHDPGTFHELGRGVDLWNADWEEAGDGAIVDVLDAAAEIGTQGAPILVEVGLSGTPAEYLDYVAWPMGADVFVESYGDENEHVHIAIGTPT
jgi:hypothetical protein